MPDIKSFQYLTDIKEMKSELDELVLTEEECRQMSVLLVEPEALFRGRLKAVLGEIGVGYISDVDNHGTGITRFSERKFTHVIFSVQETNLKSDHFLSRLLEMDDQTVTIASSSKPDSDEIFELLKQGAKGYLVLPFTRRVLEGTLTVATKGRPLPRSVLQNVDRNRGLSAMVSTTLDRLADVFRAKKSSSRPNDPDLPLARESFRRAVQLAKTFSAGGPERLLSTMQDYFIEQSNKPASRLGKLRQRLQEKRDSDPQP